MFKIKAVSHFCAAHFLREYQGECESLHGHNWRVEATISCQKLDSRGLAVDFKEVKRELKGVLDTLDHKCLNQLDFFKKENTTSENIAYYIFQRLDKRLRSNLDPQTRQRVSLSEVAVWETDSSCAIYSKEAASDAS
jgi:6-pyruvoyltetrahydropterin/6-carboxytetrahydropterin synthase